MRALPWSDVQEVVVRGGSVHVMKSGEASPRFTARVSGVANLHLFLVLAGNLGGKQRTH